MAETFETIEARSLLTEGQYTEALRELEKIPPAERDGEWYFLRSRVEEGMECYYNSVISLKKAVELSPESKEYKKALKEMQKKSKEASRTKGGIAAGMLGGAGSVCDSFRDRDYKGCAEGCGECCFEGCCECLGEAACDGCDCDCS